MSPELTPILVAIATVGVAQAALVVGLFAWLRQDARRMEDRLTNRIDRLESQMNERIGQLESRTNDRFDRLENRLAAVEHGQAKLEGLLEGLREAISGRRAAS